MRQKRIGVVVGRFQTPFLHEGHRHIIETALSRHKTVLVVLGSVRSLATKRDPLDYAARRAMILGEYPDVRVVELHDSKLDSIWSENLDRKIEAEFPGAKATLYGSRGSFIPYYMGIHKCVTLRPKNADISATKIRENIVSSPENSESFRKGAVYAISVRPPLSYQTVDVAILSHDGTKVLLAGKKEEPGVLRFIGGFVDKSDDTLEFAAKREVYEETTGIEIDNLRYVASHRIDDWRYRGTEDGIMTAFYKADYIFGAPRPADDIDSLAWVDLSKLMNVIVEAHKPLAERLLASLTN